jgi:glycosyltransferase involved in cell wall biosynthesis
MHILFLAPHPFYQERGTPIAVNLLLKAFSEKEYVVDVVTYHEGFDVEHDNVQLYRIPEIPGINNIRPGFSWKKIICDLLMIFVVLKLLRKHKYDLIHSVEESVFFALFFKSFWGIPYVYDMDSSLSQQIIDKKPYLKYFSFIFRLCESFAVRHAIAVVPVCEALYRSIQTYCPRRVVVLHDVSLLAGSAGSRSEELREKIGIPGLLVMYVGNLESYQGIDLLLDSFALVLQKTTPADLVIIGGVPKDIGTYQQKARALTIEHKVHFLGPKPIEHLGGYLAQADIVVSPRLQGENTPMKLYSYLHSGKALLATNLPTHTQVLNSRVAMLADPTPEAFSEALVTLMGDQRLRSALGQAGKRLIEDCYSYTSFRAKIFGLFDTLEQELAGRGNAQTSVAQ